MAYITWDYCKDCEETTHHCNGECSQCRERRNRKELAAWQAQTVEEKLLDLHKRLQKLEKEPIRY